jgi:hypothetical protein
MLISHDQRNQSDTDAEGACDISLLYAGTGHSSYFGDISITELSLVRGRNEQSEFIRVLSVLGLRDPFQISRSVIHLDSVEMVDLRKVEGIRNKGLSNKSVDKKSSDVGISAEANSKIFFPSLTAVDAWANDLPKHSKSSEVFIDDDTIQTADTTVVADFINSFETRDRSPFFNNIHCVPLKVNQYFNSGVTKGQGV